MLLLVLLFIAVLNAQPAPDCGQSVLNFLGNTSTVCGQLLTDSVTSLNDTWDMTCRKQCRNARQKSMNLLSCPANTVLKIGSTIVYVDDFSFKDTAYCDSRENGTFCMVDLMLQHRKCDIEKHKFTICSPDEWAGMVCTR